MPIRSNYAAFGDYDDSEVSSSDEDSEFDFVLLKAQAGTIARRRARRWRQIQKAWRSKLEGFADVDTSFQPVDWETVPGGFAGERKGGAIEQVRPQKYEFYTNGVTQHPDAAYDGDDEMILVRKAKALALEKLTAATTRRKLLMRDKSKLATAAAPAPAQLSATTAQNKTMEVIELTTPVAQANKNMESNTLEEHSCGEPNCKKRKLDEA